MTQPTDPFPVTTALELPGTTVRRVPCSVIPNETVSPPSSASTTPPGGSAWRSCAAYLDEAEGAMAGLPGMAVQAPVAGHQPRRGWLSRRGHAETAEPAPGWQRTGERFRDPSSGMIMRVWVGPADGSRHYLPDDLTAG
jgi:hypothetical protein